MGTEWEPVRQARTHELVLDRIEEQVLAGHLHAGDRLPPERQLAAALGVSRAALREALRVLEASGIVATQAGRGPNAGVTITAQPADAVGRILRLHLALGSYRTEDILETRVLLERCSVIEAARQAAAEDLDAAERLLETMADDRLTVAEFNDLDTQFHVQLARCSGNELTCTLTAAVRESIRPRLLAALAAVDGWAEMRVSLQTEHRTILRLVREGESAEAARVIEEHIRGFHGTLTEGSPPPPEHPHDG